MSSTPPRKPNSENDIIPVKRSSNPSSSISTTPSKVLMAKFDSLDQQWNLHKAMSPIKRQEKKTNTNNSSSKFSTTVNSIKRSNNKRRSEPSPGDRGIENRRNDRSQRRQTSLEDSMNKDVNDNDSVGASTVSTLSSTESIFDRLYRRGIKNSSSASHRDLSSSRHSSHDNIISPNKIARSSGNIVASPTAIRRRSNKKDHLGAYCNRKTVDDTSSLGYTQDKTPRRRTKQNQRSSIHHSDTSSIASTLSGGSGFDNKDTTSSVFSRLYRNEKRTEKLWNKPSHFTPELSSSSKRKNKTAIDHEAILLQQQQQDPNNNKQRNLIEQENPRADNAGVEISTTLEEDLEAINQIGRQLGNTKGCSPTIVATSVLSTWEETSHIHNFNHKNNTFNSPTIDPFKRHGASHTTKTTPSVEQEVIILEAVGKQLEKMEANQQQFLISSSHSNKKSSCISEYVIMEQKEEKETTVNKDRTISMSNDTNSTTTTVTDNYGFFTLEQPTRSFSTDPPSSSNYFFAERIDRLSVPIRRRKETRDDDVDKINYEIDPIFTPRRLRGGACITIQRAWRVHRAELQLAMTMIQSWNSTVHFHDKCLTDSSINRQRALQKAIRTVNCWWILEGLLIHDDWISIAWENEVRIGDAVVQVDFKCEAKSLRVSCHWKSFKLAVLLVKAGLKKSIRDEQAAQRVIRWYKHSKGKLHKNATILQLWFRNCRSKGRCPKDQQLKDGDCASPVEIDRSFYENSYDSSEASLDLREEVFCEIPSPPVSNNRHLHKKHVAAIKIQSFLRITALKSAVKDRPSTIKQLQVALRTVGSNHTTQLTSFDEFDAARNVLCSNMIAQHFSGTQCCWGRATHNMISEKEFISQRAAALAIHNIVRVYLTGLKKYKDKKRATLIQAIFRGYIVRKRIELQDLSAVLIQFAWSNRRYTKIKAKNAIKIQRFWRMRHYQRNYEMHRFCIIFIQAGWRRAIARQQLKLLKSSTILVQKTWRGSRERKSYLKFQLAIMTIQYLFQIRRTIIIYQEECCSAAVMQTWWRMRSARFLMLQYLKAKSCIQSHMQGFVQRKKFRQTKLEIVKIQRNWRKYNGMKLLQAQKSAAIRLQTFCRSYLSIECMKRRRRSVLNIQRVYRCYRCQKRLIRAVISVIKLQTHWRRHHDQVMFINYIKAATILQTFTRAAYARHQFLAYYKASLDIQRLFRGYLGRQLVSSFKETARKVLTAKQLNGAIVVQKTWRMNNERQRYNMSLRSIILLQNVQRKILTQALYKKKLQSGQAIQSWLLSITEKSRTKKSLVASIEIQRIWRAALGKKIVGTLRRNRSLSSSILIQSMWRGSRACDRYTEIRNSIITIQAYVRRMLSTKCIKRLINDRVTEKACILIQCHWRAALALEHYEIVRVSAIKIQAYVRGILATKFIERLTNDKVIKKASILVQSNWRGALAREHYDLARVSAITIQASIRRILTNKCIERLANDNVIKQACVLIQSNWRKVLVRGSYIEARASGIIIQSTVRRVLALNSTEKLASAKLLENDTLARVSAIKIQTSIRRALASTLKKDLEYKRATEKASIRLQANWRTSIARRNYVKVCAFVIIIQASTRRMLSSKKTARLVQYKRAIEIASVLLQTNWRAAFVRGNYNRVRASVIIIQASTRRMLSSKITRLLRYERAIEKASILFQANWRGAIARGNYDTVHASVIIIQASTRRILSSKILQILRYERAVEKSSILLQANWRTAIARGNYDRVRVSVIIIQAFIRRMLSSKIAKFLQYERTAKKSLASISAITIQAVWRKKAASKSYREARFAAIIIQASVRGMLEVKLIQSLRYELAVRSSTLIQSYWRRATVRSGYSNMHAAATIMQAAVRRMIGVKFDQAFRHERATRSLILIQSYWRRAIARSGYSNIRIAAILIQAAVRGMLVFMSTQRLRYTRAIKSSVLIQSYWRGAIVRIEHDKSRVAAIFIQASVRGMLVFKSAQRFRFERATKSSVLIQLYWRRAIARIRYDEARVAAISIQASVRGMVAFKFTQRLKYERAIKSSVLIQLYWRGAIARFRYNEARVAVICIQAYFRGMLARARLDDTRMAELKASIHIQRVYRGAAKRMRLKNARIVKSLVSIQRTWRSCFARGKFHRARIAGRIIQSSYRAYQIRLRRCATITSATSIQAVWRRALVRSHLRSFQTSTIMIQCVGRGSLVRKQLYRHYSAVLIQSYWRGSQARDAYCQYRVAAMTIQAMIRGAHVRSKWRFIRLLSKKKNVLNEAAKKIQIAYTLWRMNIAVWEMRSLAVLLQRGIRGQLTRSVVQYALMHMNSSYHSMIVRSYDRLVVDRERGLSAIIAWNRAVSQARGSVTVLIQSFMRGILVRKLIKEEFGRVFDSKLVFTKPTIQSQNAALVIQRPFHTWLQSRNYSAIIIQKSVRRLITLNKFCDTILKISAVTKIQTRQRCRDRRYRFLIQKRLAIKIQTLWRKILARNSFLASKTASCLIQKIYRSYHNRKDRKFVLAASVVRVQSLVRRVLARRLALERIVLNQLLTDTRLTSALIVDNLLSGHGLKTSEPCLSRLVDRVSVTLNEADSFSNQIFPGFVHRDPLVIPFPHIIHKPEPPTSFCSKTTTITSARYKKANKESEKSEAIVPVFAKPLPSIAETLVPEYSPCLPPSPERVAAGVAVIAATIDDTGKNCLAKQATKLKQEARRALQKNRKEPPQDDSGNILPNRHKETTGRIFKNNTVDENTTLENFGGGVATMPSPIKEERTDWGWTSMW